MNSSTHVPVLAAEALSALKVRDDGVYVDATFGRGGHTGCILSQLGESGRVLALDRDPDAITDGRLRFKNESRLTLVHARFSALKEVLLSYDLDRRISGLIIDLGISSPQVDNAARGFSFLNDGPLDMRMDPSHGVSAADWLASVSDKDLVRVLRRYGEERFAKRIAHAIVTTRELEAITTTHQLAKLVSNNVPVKERFKHPATRTFQAIRIYLNEELDEVVNVLPQATESLAEGGRLIIISFHSLEDRLVKRFLRNAAKGDDYPPDFPVTAEQLSPSIKLIGKPVRASEEELARNPRSRSAIMRVAEKLVERTEVRA